MRFRFRLWAIVSRIVVSGALVVTCLLSSCEYGSDTGSGALAWSPDGTKIAFSSMRSVSQNIWVMSAGGTNETNTNAISGNPNPTWSPDGSKIAFSSSDVSPPGYSHIWVMDTDGSNLVNLTCKVRASSVDPAGSHSGDIKELIPYIWVMNTASSNQIRLTLLNSMNRQSLRLYKNYVLMA